METNQRPAGSRDTVTVVGSTAAGRGRDQTMSRGWDIFARVIFPSRYLNAERVYSALARDFFFDLKRGYLARLAKKFVNAPCRWRSVCWSGTEDTSDR